MQQKWCFIVYWLYKSFPFLYVAPSMILSTLVFSCTDS